MFGLGKKKDPVSVNTEAEIKKGIKHMGSMKICAGHTLFEFNFHTGELKKAEIEQSTIVTADGSKTFKKTRVNPHCQYIGFLNRQNAVKKLTKFGFKVVE